MKGQALKKARGQKRKVRFASERQVQERARPNGKIAAYVLENLDRKYWGGTFASGRGHSLVKLALDLSLQFRDATAQMRDFGGQRRHCRGRGRAVRTEDNDVWGARFEGHGEDGQEEVDVAMTSVP